LTVIQTQIQALLAEGVGEVAIEGSNTGSHIKVAKLLMFNREAKKLKDLLQHTNYI